MTVWVMKGVADQGGKWYFRCTEQAQEAQAGMSNLPRIRTRLGSIVL